MANYLKMDKKQQIYGLLQLGWSYRRIEKETGIRRETVSRYHREWLSKAARVPAGLPEGRSTAHPYRDFIEAGLKEGPHLPEDLAGPRGGIRLLRELRLGAALCQKDQALPSRALKTSCTQLRAKRPRWTSFRAPSPWTRRRAASSALSSSAWCWPTPATLARRRSAPRTPSPSSACTSAPSASSATCPKW